MTTFGNANPRILGVAGGGLNNASWLRGDRAQQMAKIGQGGEVRTAAVLNALAEPTDGPTVMHDLMAPSQKYKANIDHLVVAGSTVHIIDAKVWKPGRYWTLASKTYRGRERFEPAEKQTMVVLRQALEAYLDSLAIHAVVLTPTLVVWPSSDRTALRTGLLSVPGARVWTSATFEKRIAKMHRPGGRGATHLPADPAIVAALLPLLVTAPRTAAAPFARRVPTPPASDLPVMPAPRARREPAANTDFFDGPLPSLPEDW